VVNIAVGQNDSFDGRVTETFARVKRGALLNLFTNIG
jgi:hypothetical protein